MVPATTLPTVRRYAEMVTVMVVVVTTATAMVIVVVVAAVVVLCRTVIKVATAIAAAVVVADIATTTAAATTTTTAIVTMLVMVLLLMVVVVATAAVVRVGIAAEVVVQMIVHARTRRRIGRGGGGGGRGGRRRRCHGTEIQPIVQPDHRNTWQGLLSIVGVPGRGRLGTPVRIGRRTLQWRVLWHEADRRILPHAGRNLRLGALACGVVFDLDRWQCGRRWIRCLVFDPRLLHHDAAVELLERYLPVARFSMSTQSFRE